MHGETVKNTPSEGSVHVKLLFWLSTCYENTCRSGGKCPHNLKRITFHAL